MMERKLLKQKKNVNHENNNVKDSLTSTNNKIDKASERLKKKEKVQILCIKNDKRDITTDALASKEDNINKQKNRAYKIDSRRNRKPLKKLNQ